MNAHPERKARLYRSVIRKGNVFPKETNDG